MLLHLFSNRNVSTLIACDMVSFLVSRVLKSLDRVLEPPFYLFQPYLLFHKHRCFVLSCSGLGVRVRGIVKHFAIHPRHTSSHASLTSTVSVSDGFLILCRVCYPITMTTLQQLKITAQVPNFNHILLVQNNM